MGRRLGAHLLPLLTACVAVLHASSALGRAADDDSEHRLLAEVRQLTFVGRRAGEGYFSGDGSRMVFQSEREPGNPFYQMYTLEFETGRVDRVSPGFGKTTCGWIHPDGRKVLFASTHEDPDAVKKQREELDKREAGESRRYSWSFDAYYDIHEVDLETGVSRNLTRAFGYDAEGAWSPDGKQIVFASNRHAYAGALSQEEKDILERDPSYFMEVYIMDADGGDVRRLTRAPGYDGGTFFSADGNKIVWRRFAEDGATAEIFTMNLDGTAKTEVTGLGAMSWAPYFHPSGDYIIFSTNLHGFGNFELYLVDADGENDPVRVTHSEGFDGLPAFSPDGTKLAWTSGRGANKAPQIFIAAWNDSAARELLRLAPAAYAARSKENLASVPAGITADDLRGHVAYLASEPLAGRLTGSRGSRLASAYLARAFAAIGLEPAGDDGGFFQEFEFTAGVSLGPSNRLTLGRRELALDRDWRPLALSTGGAVGPAPIAFAGYGIVAPEGDGFEGYDSYADLDVSGKWAMVFRYLPEDIPPKLRQRMRRYAELRYKAAVARRKGAVGLVVVSGPNAGVKDQLVALTLDAAPTDSGFAAVSIADAVGEELVRPTGKSLKALQDDLDGGELVRGFAIDGATLAAEIDVVQEKRAARNVVARLPAVEQANAPVVVIGAHLDHLGRGISSASLARGDERHDVHFGADDNASGVAAVVEIARHLSALNAAGRFPLARNLVFAAWSGEELGLLGSSHFVETVGGPAEPLDSRVAAYLNLDMVGRLTTDLILQGVGSSSNWRAEIERGNVPVGLPLALQNDAYVASDATSFVVRGVPVLNAFTGPHDDYHTPGDTADKLNLEGTAKVAGLMARIARSLALSEQPPDYIEQVPPRRIGRRGLRAYLGTIPDYARTDVKGVRISGLAKGSPAAEGGIRPGDVVVEIAGAKIENIYDYAHALDALKIGEPVNIGVVRESRRLELTVTPESRE